jgi:RNA polymerase sigma-54 factor
MAVSQRLDLRQTQSLVMTPQLQQAIKLLQLSNLELTAYVEQELERNPLLERDESGEAGPEAADTPAERRERAEGGEAPDSAALTGAETMLGEADAPLDTDYENVYDTSNADQWPSGQSSFSQSGGGASGDEISLDQRTADRVTLRQHLLDQLQMDIRDPAERLIGAHLIGMLDENGYLTGDLGELAASLGCPQAQIEQTLAKVQRFDPAGIFARSLRECLALQLADRDRLDPAMEALLDNLPLVARRDFGALAELCGVDHEDLTDMLAELKALNPKPAYGFDVEEPAAIVPDILMRPGPKGGWIIELNSETLPRVLINTRYHAQVSARARSKQDREYLAAQYQSANWLVRSLHQRATTILKVSSEIVRRQDAFFRKGIQHLKPLILRDIAEAIDMHESTVSRVTSNKYIATPRGLFELKYFFTSAIGGANGETHSAEAVRHRIKTLIDAESPGSILSDDAIVARLRADGVDIARRTVAKYREAMRIPSSVQRRREKAELA